MTAVKSLFGLALLVASTVDVLANEPPAWINEGPYVDAPSFSLEVPLKSLATKLLVTVEVGGKPRRFVFDTGSPSMLSAELAEELALDFIDTRQGRDGQGKVVETKIAQTDFTVGETTFRKVPVYVAEFPTTASCLFDGVLGSELLPLCAWQIDLPDQMLRCTTELSQLKHTDQASRIALHSYGYPHIPFFDIGLAKNASSKVMFDTGSSDFLAISPPDFVGASRNKGVGKTVKGQGSIGGSLGGEAPSMEQVRAQLKSIQLDTLTLGRVDSVLRSTAPSLLGASLLNRFTVTLDSKNSQAFLDRYSDESLTTTSFGFGLSFEGTPSVSMVWEKSPAAQAGLTVGAVVQSINDRPIRSGCDDQLATMAAMTDNEQITIGWNGNTATLTKAPSTY